MESSDTAHWVVRAGDIDGLGSVYSERGALIERSGEKVLRTADGWEVNVRSPWRTVLPRSLFAGFGGNVASNLYVTTERIVILREIDVWRELKEDLSPLGVPAAAAKEVHLRKLKAAGARQYCEVWPRELRVVKRKIGRSSWLDLRLIGTDGKQYAITLWKTKGLDPETLTLIQSQFKE
jgi:hypothetical protein